MEAAAAQRKALDEGDKKSGTTARWQVVKVDRPFVAINKVHGVSGVYSDDHGVKRLAKEAGMQVKGVGDRQVPPPETASLFPAP